VLAHRRVVRAEWTRSAAAPARDLGLSAIDAVACSEKTVQGNVGQFDVANSKVKIFQTGGTLSGLLLEAIAGDLSTANVFRLVAIGSPLL
jgi:hypothetical protein